MIDLTKEDLDQATRTLDGEAGNDPESQDMVSWSMRNRLEFGHPWWGDTISRVCRKHAQYSCWNGGADTDRINLLKPTDPEYLAAEAKIKEVMAKDQSEDPTGGMTTYKVTGTEASWDHAVADYEGRVFGKHIGWRLSPEGHCLPFLDETDLGPPPQQEIV